MAMWTRKGSFQDKSARWLELLNQNDVNIDTKRSVLWPKLGYVPLTRVENGVGASL